MTRTDMTVEEARRIITPMSDIFARWLLSAPGHEHLTKSFINAVLEDSGHEQIESVQILSPFNLAESLVQKETILDVKVSDASGRSYDIEIQTSTADSFWNRITYYNNTIYNSQLGSGGQYDAIKNTTVIALLKEHIYGIGRKVRPGEKMHHYSLVVHENNHDELFYPGGDPEKYHILELDRFALNPDALYTVEGSEKKKLSPSLFRWLRFFTQGFLEDYMEKYKETDVMVKEAKDDYEKFLSDAQLREAQLQHEMFLHDQAQARSDAEKSGYSRGYDNGIAKGVAQERMKTAGRMKADGIPADKIAAYTGLSAEEIATL